MIVGTAGHVDHGKTSLVRALTGVDTDRLAEEKARGITIELGFAYAALGGADGDEPVGFVDVPGHQRFVQTMIAGASGIDVGLLVVAADDGPMPQTREHLDILRWLGVDRLVVALTKIDRADADGLDASTGAVAGLLADTPYRDAPIVPVSAVSGAGLDALAATLRAHGHTEGAAPAPTHRADGRAFRLPIDRAFVLQGIGLVVTGTCVAGSVGIDDALVLLPGHREARVRGIHAQGRRVDRAHAGQRVALNVVGRGVEKSVVQRGHWIVAPSVAFETQRFDVSLEVATTTASTATGASRAAVRRSDGPVRDGRPVRFHAGAAACNARIVRLDPVGRPTLAQVMLDTPMHVVAGDRFVLRGPGDAATTDAASTSFAGGIVLDVDVPARGRRSDARLRFLDVAATGDPRSTLVAALDASPRGVALARWNATHNTSFGADVAGRAVGVDPASVRLFAGEHWDAMQRRIVDVLAAEHARVPDAVGPGRDRLRRMALPGFDATTFGPLVDALKADGRIVQAGAWLHLPSHRVELSDDDRRRFARAAPLLDDGDRTDAPPRVRDVARALDDDEAVIRALFARLASRGEMYRVAHDHYFLPSTVRRLAAAAAEVAALEGAAKAAAFRDRIGFGRKVAIQVLEFFDRVGYTRRIGDAHRVVQPALFDD